MHPLIRARCLCEQVYSIPATGGVGGSCRSPNLGSIHPQIIMRGTPTLYFLAVSTAKRKREAGVTRKLGDNLTRGPSSRNERPGGGRTANGFTMATDPGTPARLPVRYPPSTLAALHHTANDGRVPVYTRPSKLSPTWKS